MSAASVPSREERLAVRDLLQVVQREIRAAVVAATERQATAELSDVADDSPGDTIYQIDKVSDEVLVHRIGAGAARIGGVVLMAEGLPEAGVVLPEGFAGTPKWRILVDPIDGTRGLMYQKRSAWVLAAAAPERGPATSLSDVVVAVQTELPLVKQHLCDDLWAIRGEGAHGRRWNRISGAVTPLSLVPSRATDLRHGFAMLARFFPGQRDVLAAVDDAMMQTLLGSVPGKALVFEDQYLSSGGQLYELIVGHDRFNADLRPLLAGREGLCCHPYDVCTSLIAQEAGVVLTDPRGHTLDMPLNITADVAWVGYANPTLRALIEPVLQRELRAKGLLGPIA